MDEFDFFSFFFKGNMLMDSEINHRDKTPLQQEDNFSFDLTLWGEGGGGMGDEMNCIM